MINVGGVAELTPCSFDGDDGRSSAIGRVLALLSSRGQLTATALARARAAGGTRIDRTLLDLGLIPEEAMAAAYAGVLDLPLCSTAMLAAMAAAAPNESLNPAFLRANRVLPLPGTDGVPEMVLADPLDPRLRRALVFALGQEPRWAVAPGREIEALLARILPAETAAGEDATDLLEGDAERLRDLANEGPVVRQVGDLVQKALSLRATDIHVEPMADRLVYATGSMACYARRRSAPAPRPRPGSPSPRTIRGICAAHGPSRPHAG